MHEKKSGNNLNRYSATKNFMHKPNEFLFFNRMRRLATKINNLGIKGLIGRLRSVYTKTFLEKNHTFNVNINYGKTHA